MIEKIVKRVEAGGAPALEQMAEAIGLIMAGRAPRTEIARFLAGPAPQGRDRGRSGRRGRRHAAAHDAHPHQPHRRDRHLRHRRRRLADLQHQHGRRAGRRRGRRAGGQTRQPRHHQPQRLGRRPGRPGRQHRGRACPWSRPAWKSWASASASPPCCTRPCGTWPRCARGWACRRSSTSSGRWPIRPAPPLQLLGVGRSQLQPLLAQALALLGTAAGAGRPRGRRPGRGHPGRHDLRHRGRPAGPPPFRVGPGRLRPGPGRGPGACRSTGRRRARR